MLTKRRKDTPTTNQVTKTTPGLGLLDSGNRALRSKPEDDMRCLPWASLLNGWARATLQPRASEPSMVLSALAAGLADAGLAAALAAAVVVVVTALGAALAVALDELGAGLGVAVAAPRAPEAALAFGRALLGGARGALSHLHARAPGRARQSADPMRARLWHTRAGMFRWQGSPPCLPASPELGHESRDDASSVREANWCEVRCCFIRYWP